MSQTSGRTLALAAGEAVHGALPGLRGLDHVGITVPDIDEATRFLVDVLGCEYLYTLGPLSDDGQWMAAHLNVHPRAVARTIRFFRCGANPVLEVFEYSSPDQEHTPPRNSDVGGHHVALYVDDLDAAIDFLRNRGVNVLGGPTSSAGPHAGQRWVYFLAPWGGQFELVSYPHGRAWYREHDLARTTTDQIRTGAAGHAVQKSSISEVERMKQADNGRRTVIEADSVTKRFGGVVAVNDVSVAVREAEIYGLIGENGAGKSTLMRMLAGLYVPDSGEIRVDGQALHHGAKAALDAGIAIVHQELSLVPEMTVAENIMLGAFPTKSGFTRSKPLRASAAAALREIGIDIDLDEPVGRLSVALRQFVEIARAIARRPRVLIMDEPTASLTPSETDHLLNVLQRLAERGMAIIYISHRLPEIFRICTRVTVLRDGALVDTVAIADTSPGGLVNKMVGRELKLDLQVRRESHPGEIVLSARGITAPRVRGVDLDVRSGQIVGLGGLVGAGRSELVRAILGVDPKTAGTVTMTINGKAKRITNYGDAVAHGAAYVPEERRTEGLALTMSVADNITLPNRERLSSAGVLKVGKLEEVAKTLADKVGLRPPVVTRAAGEYSGGNQQKVVIAKWLGRQPRLVVLDEPTRGVDVGAKAEIHRLVRALADDGAAVLIVSSDLPELLDLSDVIHVIRDGQVAGTLTAPNADETAVMTLAAGGRMVTTA